MLLSIRDVTAGYGAATVLRGVDVEVGEGEIVSILGANGAGKTTTMRVLAGLLRPTAGSIYFKGKQIDRLDPEERARLGIGLVPEGRGILGSLTVEENLRLGLAARRLRRERWSEAMDEVLQVFPVLADRLRGRAAALSGGQQQMLAIARTLLMRPELMLVDELSFGLAPGITAQLLDVIERLRKGGTTFLLVEQTAAVLNISDRTYVLVGGRIGLEGDSASLKGSDFQQLARAYTGLKTGATVAQRNGHPEQLKER